MYSKADLFNLALGFLLLSRRIINTETDLSNESKVLNTHWNAAFFSTLEDLDLNSTMTRVALTLHVETPNDYWAYAYRYPSNCVFLRRIASLVTIDNPDTQIPRETGQMDDKRVIYTNEADAIGEYISNTIPLSTLSANAGLAVAAKLARLSAPLVTGKGARTLMETIASQYTEFKILAQTLDRRENQNFPKPEDESEWVRTRLS